MPTTSNDSTPMELNISAAERAANDELSEEALSPSEEETLTYDPNEYQTLVIVGIKENGDTIFRTVGSRQSVVDLYGLLKIAEQYADDIAREIRIKSQYL